MAKRAWDHANSTAKWPRESILPVPKMLVIFDWNHPKWGAKGKIRLKSANFRRICYRITETGCKMIIIVVVVVVVLEYKRY